MDENKGTDGIIPETPDNEDNICANDEPQANTEDNQAAPLREEDNPTTPLDEELNGIVDMFQTALDNGGVLPGELPGEQTDESSADGEDVVADENARICECCGEKPCATEYGEDYPYCEACRAVMQHSPFGAKGFLTILVALFVSFAALYLTADNDRLDGYLLALQADTYQMDNHRDKACDGYMNYFSAVNEKTVGKKVALRAARAYSSLGYYSNAAELTKKYFTDAQLKLPSYSGIKNYSDEFDSFSATITKVNAIVQEPLSGAKEDIDCEALMKELDALKAVDPRVENAELTADHYNEFVIEYYKYIVVTSADRPLQERLEQLAAVEKIAPDKRWSYYGSYCDLYAKMGDTEKAEYYFNKATAYNKDDATVYASYSNAYRFCKEPDVDKMLEILTQALEVNYVPEVYRLTAVANLLKGDYTTAYSNAATAYQYYQYSGSGVTFEALYTLALCAKLTDKEDDYNQINSQLESGGYSMSKDVLNYVDGKATLDEILYNVEGDLA